MTRGLRSSPVPLYLQIEEDLRSRIRSGELGPLDRVDSELTLAETFGVSRMTARKSLDRLVGEGRIFRQPGKGTFVAPEKIAHSASTRLSFSAAMQVIGHDVTTRVLDAGMGPAGAHIATALRLPAGADVVVMRRLRLIDGAPAAIHTAYLPPQLARILSEDLTGSLNELMNRAGARVSDARDTIEAVIATADDAKLLGVRNGAALVRIEGVGRSASLEPLRFTEALYRGDRFRFALGGGETSDLHVEVRVDGAMRA